MGVPFEDPFVPDCVVGLVGDSVDGCTGFGAAEPVAGCVFLEINSPAGLGLVEAKYALPSELK